MHYYFVEKLKIVEKQLCKLNCSYGKVSHALKAFRASDEVKQQLAQLNSDGLLFIPTTKGGKKCFRRLN